MAMGTTGVLGLCTDNIPKWIGPYRTGLWEKVVVYFWRSIDAMPPLESLNPLFVLYLTVTCPSDVCSLGAHNDHL